MARGARVYASRAHVDEPRDFAQQILTLLDDSARREVLGREARLFVEQRWTWEAHFMKLEQDMQNALGDDR